jgi:hypothetical protein
MMPVDDFDPGVDPHFIARLRSIMSETTVSDAALEEPPLDLWARIAEAVASESEDASHRSGAVGVVVEYSIDANDVVASVGGDWKEFARDNGAPGLADGRLTRPLWTYFDSDDVRDIWRTLVERVRAQDAAVQVPLRCDAPGARRWLEMTITPGHGGVVHFRSTVVFEQLRTTVPLLDPEAERDESLPAVPICCWCAKGHAHDEWLEIEHLVRELRLLEDPMPSVTYGICASCRDRMSLAGSDGARFA